MTSQLHEKYRQSLAAAELLKTTYYSSTVNRSYYACVQFLLDVLFTRMNLTKEEFDIKRRQNHEGTHGWASKLIEIELAKNDRETFKWYQKSFPEFQKLRVKADYTDVIITQSEAIGSIHTANSIINSVNKSIKKK